MSTDLSAIKEILTFKIKPKEKTALLAEKLGGDRKLIAELVASFDELNTSQQGTCMSALTVISKENPSMLGDCLDFVTDHLNDKAPRVKWEASEIIGNIAAKYPKQAKDAITQLLKNTKDEGTVVKWSAAYALTEIAKAVPDTHEKLLPVFAKLAKSEEGGVKTLYTKTLKALQKS
jgi:hypothetical protein